MWLLTRGEGRATQSMGGGTPRLRTSRRCSRVRGPSSSVPLSCAHSRLRAEPDAACLTYAMLRLRAEFHPVKQIFLEQNYRSTGAVLGAALAVVRQGALLLLPLPPSPRALISKSHPDTKRIPKSLTTSHPTGSSVVLHPAPSAPDEATFIASTIRHLVAHLGGLVGFNDFAVLLRYGALSRNVEVALQKAGVPSRMVGGHKFFERTEWVAPTPPSSLAAAARLTRPRTPLRTPHPPGSRTSSRTCSSSRTRPTPPRSSACSTPRGAASATRRSATWSSARRTTSRARGASASGSRRGGGPCR